MEDITMQIPEGWENSELGKLALFATGKKDVNEGNDEGIYPFYTCSKSISHSDSYSFNKEALMIAGNGDVGTVHYYKGKFEAYQRTYVLSDFNIDVKYLYQYLKENLVFHLLKAQSGTTIQFIKIGQLTEFEILLPKSLTEQKKIAQILSTIDKAIEQTEQLIVKYERIKTGLMQDLLTKGIDENGNIRSEENHEFKDSELGRIPKEWKVEKLNYFINRLDSGVSVNADDKPAGLNQYGVLKTSALSNCKFNPIQNKIVKDFDVFRLKCPVQKDAILISRMNTPDLVGENALVDQTVKDLFLPDRLWQTIYKNENELDVFWLSKTLSSKEYRSKIGLLATGTSNSMKNISKKGFLQLLIRKPSKTEQETIAIRIKIFENLEEESKKELQKLQSIKTGLMQDLLSGKKRVTNLLKDKAL